MIAPIRILLCSVLALFALASCAQEAPRGPVVLAAASLTEAVQDVADAWAASGHARPVLSFAGTPSLARQIEGGAPADIFISADSAWMDWLEERALIRRESRHDLLSNTLVLVQGDGPEILWQAGQSLPDIIGDARIAVADTQAVPAGRYARQALGNIGAWDALETRLVPAENVRAAAALVERGEVRFGIVYASDVQANEWLGLAGQFPADSHAAIIYPAALLAESDNAEAEDFLAFMSSPQASAIFADYGFGVSGLGASGLGASGSGWPQDCPSC